MTEQSKIVVTVQQETNFLEKPKADLSKLLKILGSEQEKAVGKLVDMLSSSDPKVALAAAKALLELQIVVAKEVNADRLQRLIAQAKLSNRKQATLEDEEEEKPLVDFSTLQST